MRKSLKLGSLIWMECCECCRGAKFFNVSSVEITWCVSYRFDLRWASVCYVFSWVMTVSVYACIWRFYEKARCLAEWKVFASKEEEKTPEWYDCAWIIRYRFAVLWRSLCLVFCKMFRFFLEKGRVMWLRIGKKGFYDSMSRVKVNTNKRNYFYADNKCLSTLLFRLIIHRSFC